VIADPLADEQSLWPAYVAAAASAHLHAVAVYPLTVSQRPLGVLALYKRVAEMRPTRSEHADAAVLAELALTAILADYDKLGEVLDPQPGEAGVHLVSAATRILTLGQDISHDEAVARIRLHALHTGKTISDTARDVLHQDFTTR
jgi:hypothetical protein